MVLTSMGPQRKSKAPRPGMANSLVDIREDALGGFAVTSSGAVVEMRSNSGNYHATEAVRITLWHGLDPNEQDLGGDGVHHIATGSSHSFCARSWRVHTTVGQVLKKCR